MSEVMSLEEYKKKVLQCLMENYKSTEQVVSHLMQHYEEDFPKFIEMELTPAEAAVGMFMNLL